MAKWLHAFKIVAVIVLSQTIVGLFAWSVYSWHELDSDFHLTQGVEIGFEIGIHSQPSRPPVLIFPPPNKPPAEKT